MAEGKGAETDVIVRCPLCGAWTMRGRYEGRVEINCTASRCGAALEVVIRNGRPTVTVLATKK